MERAATPNTTLIAQKERPGVKSLKHVIMLTTRDVLVSLRQHHPHHKIAQHQRRKPLQHKKQQAS